MVSSYSGKFNRQFALQVETDTGSITIASTQLGGFVQTPFTCEFNITRNNLASQNTASFTIYNLSPEVRNQIYRDVNAQVNKPNYIKAVRFFAGYVPDGSGTLPMLFNGQIKRAWSQRNGVDFRTEIEAFDGFNAITNTNMNVTLPPGTFDFSAIKAITSQMPNILSTTIGNLFTGQSKRGLPISGNPQQTLSQITNDGFYIDSGNAYALSPNEVILGDVDEISESNGLLNTPKKYDVLVEVELLFEPRLKPSQLVTLVSTVEPRFNGVYKITGINHTGTISGAICGDAITHVTMQAAPGFIIVHDQATTEFQTVG